MNLKAVLTTADGHSFSVLVRDLSAQGFRVELEKDEDELFVGEHVALRVRSEVPTRAQIKWALGREAGGHFLETPPQKESDT